MSSMQDIVLAVDYHDAHCVIRRRNLAGGLESVRRLSTECGALWKVMQAAVQLGRPLSGP